MRRTLFAIPLLICIIPQPGFAGPSDCLESLKPEIEGLADRAEWNATIASLGKRYDRIYPEIGISKMDPKLRKLTLRALVAIDLNSAGRELTPTAVLHLRNLLSRFMGQPAFEALSASYIGSLARGDVADAKREAGTLLGYLAASEHPEAAVLYGLYPEDSAVWEAAARGHSAVVERITVKDVHGTDHELFLLLGHPENATSTLQRFHQLLRQRYGSELYINDDLVPSALGFYQHTPDGGGAGPSYIILRTENLKSDFLDFVGFHEGRHVMFKSARARMKPVGTVEIQISSNGSADLPPWYEMDLLVPSPENEILRARHAREKNAYRTFMTFEENYNHVKDLQYATRLRHQSVLEAFELHETLPPNRLFDLELVGNKIDLLNEITFKTKNTALEARMFLEKEVKAIQKDIAGAPATIAILEGLERGALVLDVNGKYTMKIDFPTATEQEFASMVLLEYEKFKRTRDPGFDGGVDRKAGIEKEFSGVLVRFQEALSERLIESYDFALGIKINLANLADRYAELSAKSGIGRDEYIDFRRELFNQGRNAKRALFKEGISEDGSNPPGP
jgi:hypothetical protein